MSAGPGRAPCGTSSKAQLEIRLQQLIAALASGDGQCSEAARCAVTAALARSAAGGALLGLDAPRCTFSGVRLYPLQAALCAPLPEQHAGAVACWLVGLGASPNICWADGRGRRHTPLSKALLMRHAATGRQLTELLLSRGADAIQALLHTCLLEQSCFDPGLVRQLIDAASPAQLDQLASSSGGGSSRGGRRPTCSCAFSASTSTSNGSNVGGCEAGCTGGHSATDVLLRKVQRKLHSSRCLSRLHAAAGECFERYLLYRAGQCFQLLLAAGAPPADSASAAAAGMEAADFALLQPHASQPPAWSPAAHHLFPAQFKSAVRSLLLVGTRRGFRVPAPAPAAASGAAAAAGLSSHAACSSAAAGPSSPAACSSTTTGLDDAGLEAFWLDGGVLRCIIRQMAPSTCWL